MTSRSISIRHTFEGGMATDFGPTAEVQLETDIMGTRVRMPFLARAENCYFELDGGVHKIGGLSKLNGTTIASGEEIRCIFDYWRQGTSGAPTQKRVVYAGTTIQKDDADGSFSSIKTGLEDDTNPGRPCVFQDNLILTSDSTTDVPQTWDQTTIADLGGSPPNFSFCVSHVNRLWAAGDASLPSRLYYSGLLNEALWNGTGGSGFIDIDPDDGDRITGIASHRGDLIIFKGPYQGSIHRISGTTPTDFALRRLVCGLGSVNHNTIFPFNDDLGFVWSDGSIRSLRAIERFGDYEVADLSLPIRSFLKERLRFDSLYKSWAATDSGRSYVLFTIPVDSSTTPNSILMMDFRFYQPGSDPSSPFGKARFSHWTDVNAYSVGRVIDSSSSNRRDLFVGGPDGFVRKTQQAARDIDGTDAISMYVKTPHFTYGSPSKLKSIRGAFVGLEPQGAYNVTLGVEFDRKAIQEFTVTQGGSDVLGSSSADQFTLGTSTLAGARFSQRAVSQIEGASFRSVSYAVSNNGVGEDLEVHTITSVLENRGEGVESFEND